MSSWDFGSLGGALSGGSSGSRPGGPSAGLSSLDSKISSLDSKISSFFSNDLDKKDEPAMSTFEQLFIRQEHTTTSRTATPTRAWQWDERTSPSPPRSNSGLNSGTTSGLNSGLGSAFRAEMQASAATAAAREAQFGTQLAREELKIETEIFKMDEDFLRSQIKMMKSEINFFNSELSSVRNDVNFESSQRKEQSGMFENYIKKCADDIDSRLKAHIGEHRETIENLSRALRSSEQKLDVLSEEQQRNSRDHGEKVWSMSTDLDAERSARMSADETIMEEFRIIRKYLDEDLQRTFTNHVDTYSMIETKVRDVSGSFESHVQSVIANDQQRERELEDKLIKLKGEFGQELIKVEGMSKDIDALRSMIDRESGERQKAVGTAVEAMRAEDAKLKKAIMDEHTNKREASQMIQDLKRAIDSESGERNKALGRLRDADAQIQRALSDMKVGIDGRYDKNEEVLRKLQQAQADLKGDLASHKSDSALNFSRGLAEEQRKRDDALEQTFQNVDRKLQQALADLKSEMSRRDDGHEDAIRKLASDHDLRLCNADAKVQQALAEIVMDQQNRHDGHMKFIRDLEGALSNHKFEHDSNLKEATEDVLGKLQRVHEDLEALLRDTDSKLFRAMNDLKGEMDGRHDGHEGAIRELQDAHSTHMKEIARYKDSVNDAHDSLMQDADAKVQRAMNDLKVEMYGRHDGHEQAMKQLKAAHAELQQETANYKAVHDAKLEEADTKVVAAMKDLQADMEWRHGDHADTLRKLLAAHQDMQTDLASHKDTQVALKREMVGRHDGHENSMRQLQDAQAELWHAIANQKSVHDAKLEKADANLQESMRDLMSEMKGRHGGHDNALQRLVEAHEDLKSDLVGTRSIITSLQAAHAELQDTAQRTERSIKEAGSSNLANTEFLTSTLNSMERSLTTLDSEIHGRIADLRSHFDNIMKDGKQDQAKQMAQALSTLKNAFEERAVGMEQEVNRRLRDTVTDLVSEQEDLQRSVQKLRSNNWDEQLKRLWEAVNTHTHDVNVEDIEEADTVTTEIIRPRVVVPEVKVVKTSVLNSPQQRSVFPTPHSSVLGRVSPARARPISPTAIIRPGDQGRTITPVRSPPSSTRNITPIRSAGGSLAAAIGPAVERMTSTKVVGKSDVVVHEKIAHHVDLHCGAAVFKENDVHR